MKYFIGSYISVQSSWFVLMEYFLIVEFSVDFLRNWNLTNATEGSVDFHAV